MMPDSVANLPKRFFAWRASLKTLGGVLLLILILLLPPSFVPAIIISVIMGMFLGNTKRKLILWLLLIAILLIKNVWLPWPWWLAVVTPLLLFVPKKRAAQATIVAVAAAWVGALGYDHFRPLQNVENADGLIACVGDSLTSLIPEGRWKPPRGYPEALAQKVRVPVINRGQSGATISMARLGFEKEVLALQPHVVIFEIGCHDQLGGATRRQIYDGLAELVRLAQAQGAFAVIWEIPASPIRDPLRGVYRQLAHDFHTGLISDTAIRRFIYQPSLTTDGLHPNAKGEELMAETVTNYLARWIPHLRR